MAIDDAHVGEPEPLKEADIVLRILDGNIRTVRCRLDLLEDARHAPDCLGNGHAVVVEHDEDVRVEDLQAVESLVDEAVVEGTVANEGDYMAALPLQIARLRKAERRRNGRARVTRIVAVVLALRALGEPRDAALLTKRAECGSSPREELVAVTLVTDVKDELILGKVKDAVQRDGELHRPQIGGQVPAALGDGRKDLLSELPANVI